MIKDRSIVLSAFFPSSKTSEEGLRRAWELATPRWFTAVEYYVENAAPRVARVICAGTKSVFLAGARQKARNLNPASLDKEERSRAVAILAEAFTFAKNAGAGAVMMSSGTRPANAADDNAALDALAESVRTLSGVAPSLPILLEPGDRDVEFHHLIGHTDMAVSFAERMRREGVPLGLIFDISHAAQLGEDLDTAWSKIRPVCDRVHFANCVLKKGSPLYGDKHPFFDVEDGVYTNERARAFFHQLAADEKELTVSIEMICPVGENEAAHFERLVKESAWFFEEAA